jgi:two-component system, response regulator PdtaR
MDGTLSLRAASSGPGSQFLRAGHEDNQAILVADDDRIIVATLGRGLRAAGFKVLEAFDSATALTLCVEQAPSVAIIDHKMPDSTGVELARSISERTAVAVIFLSAYSDPPIVQDAISAGAMTYLVKPIDVGQLLPVIRSARQRASELQKMRSELNSVKSRSKAAGVATGLLMSRFHISERDAYELIRRHARSTRVLLEDLAHKIIRSTEENNRLFEMLRHAGAAPPPGIEDGSKR